MVSIKYGIQIMAMISDITLCFLVYSLVSDQAWLLALAVLFVWCRLGFMSSFRPKVVKAYMRNFDKIVGVR